MFRAMAECHDSNTHYPKLPKFWADSSYVIDSIMAVRVGFEPTEPVKVQRFSRPPDSTTLAPHRIGTALILPQLASSVTMPTFSGCASNLAGEVAASLFSPMI